MAIQIAFTGDAVEFRPGQVLLIGRRSAPARIHVQHAAIIAVSSPQRVILDAAIPVYDWPLPKADEQLADVEAWKRGDAPRRLQLTGPVITSADGSELRDNLANVVLDEARLIVSRCPPTSDGAVIEACYCVCPSRAYDASRLEFPFSGSCAGFVEQCFTRAGIPLVDDEPPTNLPGLERTEIEDWVGHSLRQDQWEAFVKQSGAGPYHILMPGYQAAAMREAAYPRRITEYREAIVEDLREQDPGDVGVFLEALVEGKAPVRK